MPYSQFTTIGKVKQAFGIKTVEGKRFLPEVEMIAPSQTLLNYLDQTLPIAIAVSTEKARSEGIIACRSSSWFFDMDDPKLNKSQQLMTNKIEVADKNTQESSY